VLREAHRRNRKQAQGEFTSGVAAFGVPRSRGRDSNLPQTTSTSKTRTGFAHISASTHVYDEYMGCTDCARFDEKHMHPDTLRLDSPSLPQLLLLLDAETPDLLEGTRRCARRSQVAANLPVQRSSSLQRSWNCRLSWRLASGTCKQVQRAILVAKSVHPADLYHHQLAETPGACQGNLLAFHRHFPGSKEVVRQSSSSPGRRLHLSLHVLSLLHCPFVSHRVEIERGGKNCYLLLPQLLLSNPAPLSPLRFRSLFVLLLEDLLLLRDLQPLLHCTAEPFR